jgi:acyl-CoA reductase-like NAD-dependent aldehyde dehydrogenase
MSSTSTSKTSPAASWLARATWNERAFTTGWAPLSQSADVREPATGEILGRIAIASKDDIAAAATRAREQLRVGLLHINDQTVNDDVVNPFGGVGASGNGTSIGGPANWDEFTQRQWLTVKGVAPRYPL